MFRINDFSKICQVSVKSLRYWDEINLVNPVYPPGERLHRYYAVEQIGIVNRIVALQALGLSLDEIRELLHASAAEVRDMLLVKQMEIAHNPQRGYDVMLEIVEARLQQIEHEVGQCTVELKSIPSQRIVAIREIKATVKDVMRLVRETGRHAGDKNKLIAVYHDDSYYQEKLDVQVGFPLNGEYSLRIPLSPGREMTMAELPEVDLMACTLHHGGWLTLAQGYANLATWIDQNGYSVSGIGREVFHKIDWHNGGHATVRELQLPIVAASVHH